MLTAMCIASLTKRVMGQQIRGDIIVVVVAFGIDRKFVHGGDVLSHTS